jgi:ferritin-like metal-binding protein YciE
MSMNSLNELLTDQLKDIYNAEHQLLKALPKMSRGASAPTLKNAIDKHLTETEGQIGRLDRIADQLGISLKGKKCKAMEGLIAEGGEVLEEDGAEAIIDAALIAAAQRVEHYEISAYGSARAIAERLGLKDVAKMLDSTLQEESAADEKLTEISEGTILPAAQDDESDEPERSDSAGAGNGRGAAPRRSRAGKQATSRA